MGGSTRPLVTCRLWPFSPAGFQKLEQLTLIVRRVCDAGEAVDQIVISCLWHFLVEAKLNEVSGYRKGLQMGMTGLKVLGSIVHNITIGDRDDNKSFSSVKLVTHKRSLLVSLCKKSAALLLPIVYYTANDLC